MGASGHENVASTAERTTVAARVEALFDAHLNEFQIHLVQFAQFNFRNTSPPAVAASESMYFECVLDEAKALIQSSYPSLSNEERDRIVHKVAQRLLIDERIGALSQLCTEPCFPLSEAVRAELRPLAEYTAESMIKHGRTMFLSTVMQRLCPAFVTSKRFEEALLYRVNQGLKEQTFAGLSDALLDLELPRDIIPKLQPLLAPAMIAHVNSRNHPEPIVKVALALEQQDFIRSDEFRGVLERSCLQALRAGDLNYVIDTVQEYAGAQLLSLEELMTPAIRAEVGPALARARIEQDYFSSYSDSPEHVPGEAQPIKRQIRILSRLCSTSSAAPAQNRAVPLRGGLSPLSEPAEALGLRAQNLP